MNRKRTLWTLNPFFIFYMLKKIPSNVFYMFLLCFCLCNILYLSNTIILHALISLLYSFSFVREFWVYLWNNLLLSV